MMLRFLFIVFLLCCLPVTSSAVDSKNETLVIEWNDLIPGPPVQDESLAGLSEEELGTVEWVIYIRENMVNEDNPTYQDAMDEMNTVLTELQKKRIDIDRIIADRKRRNSAVNNALDGKQVKIAGYLLPLDLSGAEVTDFLLVPFVGACIHVPPPPPNQIVFATSATPQPYEIEKLYEPVWITGNLAVKSLSKELFLSDGTGIIDVGYKMTVENIEPFKE